MSFKCIGSLRRSERPEVFISLDAETGIQGFEYWDGEKWVPLNFDDPNEIPDNALKAFLAAINAEYGSEWYEAAKEIPDQIKGQMKAAEEELRVRDERTKSYLEGREFPEPGIVAGRPENPPALEPSRESNSLDPREKEALTPDEIAYLKRLVLDPAFGGASPQGGEGDDLSILDLLKDFGESFKIRGEINIDVSALGKWLALGQIMSAAIGSGQIDIKSEIGGYTTRVWNVLGALPDNMGQGKGAAE